MPSNIPNSRRRRAFTEGRRSATVSNAQNPYDNPKLRDLWEQGRAMQLAGQIQSPIPPLAHGATRAQRAPRNPPAPKRPRPSSRPQTPRFRRGRSDR